MKKDDKQTRRPRPSHNDEDEDEGMEQGEKETRPSLLVVGTLSLPFSTESKE